MASLYKLPCIFVVENNLWAIGMNHPRATGCTFGDPEPHIYKKGPAFGMPGVLVDGMDVVKVCLGLCLPEMPCLGLIHQHVLLNRNLECLAPSQAEQCCSLCAALAATLCGPICSLAKLS